MKKGIIIIGIVFLMVQCSKVPVTGRKQLKFVPTSQMSQLSFSQYEQVKSESKLLPDSDPRVQQVKTIGKNISLAVNKYLSENGFKNRVDEFQWEFNVADEATINAWCMPGGKVMFYTGILELCQDAEGIATVMGHEIAHAVGRHGNERMSTQLVAQFGTMALGSALDQNSEMTKNIFMTAVGAGSQLGMLKFSRSNESEADQMGLVFMAMAGYNPEAAVGFWQRMSQSGGAKPPEFMSTHPSDERRIADIKAFLPEAKKYMK